ncbi:hypothetical protein ACO0OE_002267 [Hanseniaspora uvarum]
MIRSNLVKKNHLIKNVNSKQFYGLFDRFKSNKLPEIDKSMDAALFDTTKNLKDINSHTDSDDVDIIKKFGRPSYNKMNKADVIELKLKRHKPALSQEFDYKDTNQGLESSYPTLENRFIPWKDLMHTNDYVNAAVNQIKTFSVCPITGGKIEYFDPISGLPTHSSEEAYLKDVEYTQSNKPELMKLAVAYENDSISKRDFPEYDFSEEQSSNQAISYLNWESWFYTREFNSMETQFHVAQASKYLTYPVTIAALLSNQSPYKLTSQGGPVTHEGLKSLSALRYSIFPRQRADLGFKEDDIAELQDRAIRIFIVGSKFESLMPISVWKQLNYCMPDVNIEIHFIGPEALFDSKTNEYISYEENHKGVQVSPELKVFYHTNLFHVNHLQGDFFPYDPYLDSFYLFHPNISTDPESTKSWMYETMKGLLETKCPIFISGHSLDGFSSDWECVMEKYEDELDVLMEPTENAFGSTKWQINPYMPTYAFQTNMIIGGIRGKRYQAVPVDE